jgi:uncharacterized membrane protein YuzA (DUF378 family)
MKFELKKTALVVAGIGATNWGTQALFAYNIVEKLPFISDYAKIVYIVVGVAGALVLADSLGLYSMK